MNIPWQTTSELFVDFGASAGVIRPLHGVNLGPWLWNGVFDASEQFRRLRIPR